MSGRFLFFFLANVARAHRLEGEEEEEEEREKKQAGARRRREGIGEKEKEETMILSAQHTAQPVTIAEP